MEEKVFPNPIISYGILLYYKKPKTGELYYLICQRRDTIEYADFIRGKYSKLYLKTYISLMTVEERERLIKYSFQELWDDLWVNHNISFYRDGYQKAKAKFDLNFEMVKYYLNIPQVQPVLEPGWGFPKGKKTYKENEIQCCLREFKEESKLELDYKNLKHIPPLTETFKGSNHKIYGTTYYIAETDVKFPIKKISLTNGNIRTETISEEISNLKWIKLSEAKEYFPVWRYKLLIEAEKKIRNLV